MHKQLDVNNYFYFEGVLWGPVSSAFPTYYYGKGGAKLWKKIWFCQKLEGIDSGVGAAASSIKGAESSSPQPVCKGKMRVFWVGESP